MLVELKRTADTANNQINTLFSICHIVSESTTGLLVVNVYWISLTIVTYIHWVLELEVLSVKQTNLTKGNDFIWTKNTSHHLYTSRIFHDGICDH